MPLKEKQKRYLRQLAHAKKPVVIVGGGGIGEGLLSELDQALDHHELLKVRVNAGDREERDAMIQELCGRTGSDLVQRIGHVAVLYRPAKKPRIQFPA